MEERSSPDLSFFYFTEKQRKMRTENAVALAMVRYPSLDCSYVIG